LHRIKVREVAPAGRKHRMKRTLVIGFLFVVGLAPLVGASAGYDPTAVLDARRPGEVLTALDPRPLLAPASLRTLMARDGQSVGAVSLESSARTRLSTSQWLMLAGFIALIGVSRRRVAR
jgi:hypothetical protein